MSSTEKDNTVLLEQYLKICNKALETNKERFPYREIIKALAEMKESENVEVCIINDHPKAELIMKRKDETVMAFPHANNVETLNTKKWNVTRSYLEDVINNPKLYIDNPALIDWEWISEEC